MLIGRAVAIVTIGAGAAAPAIWAQTAGTLTARELFYAPAAQEAPAKPNRPAKPAKPRKPAAKPPANDSSAPAATPSQAAVQPPSGVPLVAASYSKTKPLGLRYSFLRKGAGEEYEEVSADSVFHAGDRIRLSVQANDSAYLYIVMRGSSGTWKLLFPTNEIGGGSNKIESGRAYVFPPPPGRFAFDEQKGDEKLCVVLTRQPEQSLEQLIYSLSTGSPAPETGAPSAPRPMLLAQSKPIGDDLVNRLRGQVYARDLVFEKVDDTTPGERKEKAAYVVNSNASPEARLVVDVTLKHE